MAKPVVALRIEFTGREVRVTSLSQSPRGTRYPTRTSTETFVPSSKADRKEAIRRAVSAALPVED